jgi:sugar phosphate isomerase/epimerase
MMQHLTRRHWLRVAGAAALGGPALAAGREALQRKARKNLRLAVFTGVYSGLPVEQAARRIREDGFSAVVLEYRFADVVFDPWAPDWAALEKITGALNREGLRVAGLYGYYNLVDPEAARRKRGEARMQLLIENWRRFGSPVISTETGTFNAKSEWLESPDNLTEAALIRCAEVMERWTRLAEHHGAVLSIEPYWRNVVHSAARAQELFERVPSASLGLVMDPSNYFRKSDLPQMRPMLEEIFKRVGAKTVLAHAKDVRATADDIEHPAAGKGVLDYPLYLRLLAGLNREIYLTLEHLTIDDVARARDFVLSQFDRI